MKSVVGETRVKRELNYPGLMKAIYGGFIVLFVERCEGIVVNDEGDNIYSIGDYRTDWVEDSFEVFEGEVTLSND